MKIDGKITFLINRDVTELTIEDSNASSVICKIELDSQQVIAMLSRQAMVSCSVFVGNLDRVGKKHENKTFEFEIPKDYKKREDGSGIINDICLKSLKEAGMSEWKSDNYYSSQNSFFSKDGKDYARVVIRRWI